MKTIYTTLPIYDRLSKQIYERSKYSGQDKPIPILCPNDRIPSFQWNDDGDGCLSVDTIEMFDSLGANTDITAYFSALPQLLALTDLSYFIYNSETLLSTIPCGDYYLKITMDNAKVYYSEYFHTDDMTNCIKIDFHNDCDFGNIIYQTGFTQSIWLDTETLEPSYPIKEEGVENGEGRFVRTFARQAKKYLLQTKTLPDYMVDVFNRMKLHDTVFLTDLVGDTNEVLNLEVEHEWLFDDKYYAKLDLTFDYDETVIIAGCCNNKT